MPVFSLSATDRPQHLTALGNTVFDILVVGGGITGAGIALDAASRGFRVALVEKDDFGGGTSSRSTKLIHGGLRYLKQLELKLVAEVGRERAVVYKNAPHIVVPEKMLLPIVTGGSLGETLSSVALWVYDRLAGVTPDEQRKMLDKDTTARLEPLLRTDILQSGGLYYEYRTDDARLTIETLKTATEYGACCLNYAQVDAWLYNEQGTIMGASLTDKLTNASLDVRASKVINAAGPWVDTLRTLDTEGVQRKRLHLTKGVHIVVPYHRLPLRQSVYFDVPADKRMVFAIPRSGITYIGTTDTNYTDTLDNPLASIADVTYLLDAANAMFPSAKLAATDVISTWAGLRPLIHEDGKDPSELSRKDEIFVAQSGLISIAGGKLTGYRKMAERIIDQIITQLKRSHSLPAHIQTACKTATIKLGGGNFASTDEVTKFIELRTGEVSQIGLTRTHIAQLVGKYGRNTDAIIAKAFELHPSIADAEQRILAAEIWYGVHAEMCHTLADFAVRRTGRLYFERSTLIQQYPYMAEQLRANLPSQADIQLSMFEHELHAVMQWQTKELL